MVSASSAVRRGRVIEAHRVASAVQRCLPEDGRWHVSVAPTPVDGWWSVDVHGRTRHRVFVDAGRALGPQLEQWLVPCLTGRPSAENIDSDARIPADVRERVAQGLALALGECDELGRVRVGLGRTTDEVVVFLTTHRGAPLPLFLPQVSRLATDQIARIVRNVLEGLGRLR